MNLHVTRVDRETAPYVCVTKSTSLSKVGSEQEEVYLLTK